MSNGTHTVFKRKGTGELQFVSRIHEVVIPYSIDHGRTIHPVKEVCRVYWTKDPVKALFFTEEKALQVKHHTRNGRLMEFHSHRVHILGK
jgi:hypothetical protein